jgi:hypothetical protein
MHLKRWACGRLFLVAGLVSATVAVSLIPPGEAKEDQVKQITVESGPLTFTERQILDGYTYAYGIVAADLDGDGNLDLTSADAEPNSNLYWLQNDGKGNFRRHFIQKYAKEEDQPIRLERHAVGDINGDGRPDVVIVDNLRGDVWWFENPGKALIHQPWPRHRITTKGALPGAYDVALADLDGDGDLDIVASSWRLGNRFVWFENVAGDGTKWATHVIEADVPETRTVRIADFNGDGKPDILGSARVANLVVWYENPGKPATQPWKKHVIDSQTQLPVHGQPVDLDGDGDMDVLMAFGIVGQPGQKETHQIAWYENVGKPGKGHEWKKHLIAEGFDQGFEAVAADVDGDGHLDVIATGWGKQGRLVWFQNPGAPRGSWKMHMLKDNWSNANQVIVADLDRDGRLDIIACAERGANELRWWRNEGRKKK